MPSFLSPLLGAPQEPWLLRNTRSGRVLATRLEPAFDSASRRRGLLGRNTLDEGAALVIAPCSSIHTFFMSMVIDAVFVARDGRVVKTCSDLRAWRIACAIGAFAVVELAAGAVRRSGTRRGDYVQLARP